jgi:hypothetical protein
MVGPNSYAMVGLSHITQNTTTKLTSGNITGLLGLKLNSFFAIKGEASFANLKILSSKIILRQMNPAPTLGFNQNQRPIEQQSINLFSARLCRGENQAKFGVSVERPR